MTKNKVFIAAGTFALAIAGFLTTSAHKKFTAATSAYYLKSGSTIVTLFKGATIPTNNLTTVKVSNATFRYVTASTIARTVFAVKSGTTLSKTIFVK